MIEELASENSMMRFTRKRYIKMEVVCEVCYCRIGIL